LEFGKENLGLETGSETGSGSEFGCGSDLGSGSETGSNSAAAALPMKQKQYHTTAKTENQSPH
jgi:hypothetical protein